LRQGTPSLRVFTKWGGVNYRQIRQWWHQRYLTFTSYFGCCCPSDIFTTKLLIDLGCTWMKFLNVGTYVSTLMMSQICECIAKHRLYCVQKICEKRQHM
jgi:hypothetical protein